MAGEATRRRTNIMQHSAESSGQLQPDVGSGSALAAPDEPVFGAQTGLSVRMIDNQPFFLVAMKRRTARSALISNVIKTQEPIALF